MLGLRMGTTMPSHSARITQVAVLTCLKANGQAEVFFNETSVPALDFSVYLISPFFMSVSDVVF